MISYVIKVRKQCNKIRLTYYVKSFFKKGLFNSRYIYVQLKFHTADNNIISIGDNYILDIKKNREVKSYLFYILQYFCHNYLTENKNDKLDKDVFYYTETTRKEYLSQMQKFYNS